MLSSNLDKLKNTYSEVKKQPKVELKMKNNPKNSPFLANKCILTEHDYIVDAFHHKYKCEDGKQWVLKEVHLPEVIAAVNEKRLSDWIKVAWAVHATMVEINLKKRGLKIPN